MIIDIPETVTVSCPIKGFKQRYIHKGCLVCEYYKGITPLTEAEDMPIKDPLTGEIKGSRTIEWHEKFMIKCSFPMTRRCSNMAISED